MSEIIVVLGMHKSGTTLVSEMLHQSGITMIQGNDERNYDDGNHFERFSTNLINKELLKCGNRSSLKVRNVLDTKHVSGEIYTIAREMVRTIQEPAWGFKDPRTCLTYDFWQKVLPTHRLICIFRNDREVHSHYTRKRRKVRLRGVESLLAWHTYNSVIADLAQAKADNCILISYEQLMQSKAELIRLENFIDRPIVDRRNAKLRRSRSGQGYEQSRQIAKWFFKADTTLLYNKLLNLRTAQLNGAHYEY